MEVSIFSELKPLCENLKKYRKQRHLTQEELADHAGCHRTYISALERGRVNPTLSTLISISRELEVDVCRLLIDERRAGE